MDNNEVQKIIEEEQNDKISVLDQDDAKAAELKTKQGTVMPIKPNNLPRDVPIVSNLGKNTKNLNINMGDDKKMDVPGDNEIKIDVPDENKIKIDVDEVKIDGGKRKSKPRLKMSSSDDFGLKRFRRMSDRLTKNLYTQKFVAEKKARTLKIRF